MLHTVHVIQTSVHTSGRTDHHIKAGSQLHVAGLQNPSQLLIGSYAGPQLGVRVLLEPTYLHLVRDGHELDCRLLVHQRQHAPGQLGGRLLLF